MVESRLYKKIFREEDFPVIAWISLGKMRVPFDPHHHPELEFHLIRHGRCQYYIGGADYVCEKNCILIIHENETHTYCPDQAYADKKVSLIFDPKVIGGRTVSEAALCRLAAFHRLVLSDEQSNVAEFLLDEIAEECSRKDLHWQDEVVEYLEAFLIILDRASELQPASRGNKDTRVQEIIDYLEEKFTEKISLADVSERFDLSCYALSKKFKQHVGLGFREYLIHRRIVAAQKLLEETDLKVAAIADKVGFDSLSTFNRDFRMLTGVTPAVYRTISDVHRDDESC